MEGQKDKMTKGWTKEQMKGQTKKGMKNGKTQFHRILLATARGSNKISISILSAGPFCTLLLFALILVFDNIKRVGE